LATSNLRSILVIGYGNSLRSDDEAGCRVADLVASWELPYVRSLTVHQLTPELAEPIAQSELTIFVDACVSNNRSDFVSKRAESKPTVQIRKHHDEQKRKATEGCIIELRQETGF
jgi:hydrogenase maturation protease